MRFQRQLWKWFGPTKHLDKTALTSNKNYLDIYEFVELEESSDLIHMLDDCSSAGIVRTKHYPSSKVGKTTRRARDLVLSLVEEEKCYTSEQGARAFGDVCAANVIIEDRFFPQPFNGKTEATEYMRVISLEKKWLNANGMCVCRWFDFCWSFFYLE